MKFKIGEAVFIPQTCILGNEQKHGVVLDAVYDEWNEIYKYKIKIDLSGIKSEYKKYIGEWFMEEELEKK